MRAFRAVAAGCILALAGCADETHTLAGRVHYADGAPLAAGSVDVEQVGGKFGASAPLAADGTFSIRNLPAGEYAVSISRAFVPGISADVEKGEKGVPPSGPLVHERFASPATSGLRIAVPAASAAEFVVEK